MSERERIELDCGDNSCYFATNKTGMRTNGGCRCLSGLNSKERIAVRKYITDLKNQIKEARKGFVELKKVEEVLWSHRDTPCDCSKCQVLVCLEEIKELADE